MARRHLHISGSTSIGRDDMTERVAAAISRSGAVLVDFSIFANLSTMMRLELSSRQVKDLGRWLGATGLTLDEASRRTVVSWSGSSDEVVATLRITFVSEKEQPSGALAVTG